MHPGTMVTPLWGPVRMYDRSDPLYADHVAIFEDEHVGIVVDTAYSSTHILWLRVLTPTGIGWLRRTQIDVLLDVLQ